MTPSPRVNLLGCWGPGLKKKGGGQRVIGWRAVNGSAAEQQAAEKIIVMFNFEGQDVPVDIDFGFRQVAKL